MKCWVSPSQFSVNFSLKWFFIKEFSPFSEHLSVIILLSICPLLFHAFSSTKGFFINTEVLLFVYSPSKYAPTSGALKTTSFSVILLVISIYTYFQSCTLPKKTSCHGRFRLLRWVVRIFCDILAYNRICDWEILTNYLKRNTFILLLTISFLATKLFLQNDIAFFLEKNGQLVIELMVTVD